MYAQLATAKPLYGSCRLVPSLQSYFSSLATWKVARLALAFFKLERKLWKFCATKMPSRYPFSVRVALVFPLTLVPAFSITSISSAGCVAPVAFNSCTSQVDAYTLTCVNGADGDQLVLYGCYTMYYELQTKCYLVSCWNKV
jgi:hypothetical protein